MQRSRPWWLIRILVAALAIAMIVFAIARLHGAAQGLTITRTTVGTTPVTIFKPATPGKARRCDSTARKSALLYSRAALVEGTRIFLL